MRMSDRSFSRADSSKLMKLQNTFIYYYSSLLRSSFFLDLCPSDYITATKLIILRNSCLSASILCTDSLCSTFCRSFLT